MPTATRSRTRRSWSGIRSLAIPPACRDVWISPNPRAKVQAAGVDGAGRRPYRYSASFREAQQREKYDRLIRFGERLPELRERMSEHMALDASARERVCAVAVRLIDLSWFRVGSERPARARRVCTA